MVHVAVLSVPQTVELRGRIGSTVKGRGYSLFCTVSLRKTACSMPIMPWCSCETEWPIRKSTWNCFTLSAVILYTASQSIYFFCFAKYNFLEEMKISFKVLKFSKFVFNNFPLNFHGNLWQCRPQTYIHM